MSVLGRASPQERMPSLSMSKKPSADYFPIRVLISPSSVSHPAHILAQERFPEHPSHVWDPSKLSSYQQMRK